MALGGIIAILFWIALGGIAGGAAFLLAALVPSIKRPREDSADTQAHGDWPFVPDFHSSHVRSNTDA